MATQQEDREILKTRLIVPMNAQFMEKRKSRNGCPGWKQVCGFIFGLLFTFATHLRADATTELSFDADPNRLLQADGTPLPERSVILFGSFTNATNDPLSLVRSLPSPTASNILTTLRSNFLVWRSLNYTNGQDLFQNTTSPAGATRTNLAGRPVYLWVYNSTNTNATNADNLQIGIFRARGTQVFPDATETDYSVGLTLNNNPNTDDFPGTGILFGRYVTNSGAQSFRLAPVTNVETSTMGANTNFTLFTDIPFEVDVTANNGANDFTWTPTNLPGSFLFTNNGTFSGQFAQPTNVVVEVVASNNEGWDVRAVTHRLNFTVNPLTLTASNSQSPVAGVAQATNAGEIFSSPGGTWTNLTPLPPGVTLGTNGSLSGTVWSTNSRFILLRQIDGSATNFFRLNLNPSIPTMQLEGLAGGRFRVRQGQAATNTNLTFSARWCRRISVCSNSLSRPTASPCLRPTPGCSLCYSQPRFPPLPYRLPKRMEPTLWKFPRVSPWWWKRPHLPLPRPAPTVSFWWSDNRIRPIPLFFSKRIWTASLGARVLAPPTCPPAYPCRTTGESEDPPPIVPFYGEQPPRSPPPTPQLTTVEAPAPSACNLS
jgi:hypothetical protein